MSYPVKRLRTYLNNRIVRSWLDDSTPIHQRLMYPIFITNEPDTYIAMPTLFGAYTLSVEYLLEFIEPFIRRGLRSIILFGVVDSNHKDNHGSYAGNEYDSVYQAVTILRSKYSIQQLYIVTDICICTYTDHGHCNIFVNDKVDIDKSTDRLAEITLAYAKAGVDAVAPSDMNDYRVLKMREKLDKHGYEYIPIISYSPKYQSSMYGPFRDVCDSSPSFGDRSTYQLPPKSHNIGMLAAERDISEGASMLIIKPSIYYLDILKSVRDKFPYHPLAGYHVSGEYMSLFHSSNKQAIDFETGLFEASYAILRAGGNFILTYGVDILLPKRILVLGAGYTGTRLISLLKKHNSQNVITATTRRISRRDQIMNAGADQVFIVDCSSESAIQNIIYRQDIIVVAISPGKKNNFYVDMAQNIVKYSEKHQHIIFLSSTSVYKQSNHIHNNEETVFFETNHIIDAENFIKSHKLYTILRLGHIIGSDEDHNGTKRDLISHTQMIINNNITIQSSGKIKANLCDVDDICDCIRHCMIKRVYGTYNCIADVTFTKYEQYNKIAKFILKTNDEIKFIHNDDVVDINNKKIKKTGFVFKNNFEFINKL